MSGSYVHGYQPRENERLQDQAGTLVDLLHSDTTYPAGSTVLEVGCGVGAQTLTLAQQSPQARITSVDVSADSIAEAKRRAATAGITNVDFQQGISSTCPSTPSRSTTYSSASSWSIWHSQSRPWLCSAG